jgi:hypothetical protein
MLKFFVVAGLGCAIGFGAGYPTGWRQRLDDPELALKSQMREVIWSQSHATALSLAVLGMLERGDVGKAKSKLAQQVVEYQRSSWAKYDGVLPGQPKLLPLIQEAIQHSPALQEELAQPPK